jgi:serine/threonine-protein kinase
MIDPSSRLNAALEGRYRIERKLGEGGMATVYLADDLRHERKVALKVLKPELAAVVGGERFLAEIKTTANLQHPHILPLFDSGEADGFLFYVMPYIEGETLRDRIDRERQLPVEDAVQIATVMADGLDFAHRKGVIHRDIKPANVLLLDGKPVISDFGIALAVSTGGGARLTETGLSLGTPHYMSPEQATGDLNVGPATDIYALGCVLYEMLVGEPPFTGSTPQAILGRIITGEVPSARAERASVPANVDAAIASVLEKVPADRPRTALEFSRALSDSAYRHGTTQAAGASAGWDNRSRGLAGLCVLLAVACIALWTAGRSTPDSGGAAAQVGLRFSVALPESENQLPTVRVGPDGTLATAVDGRIHVKRPHDDHFVPIEHDPLVFFSTFEFSPDGQSIIYSGRGALSDRGVYRVGIGGGAVTPLARGVAASTLHVGEGPWIYVARVADSGLSRVASLGGTTEDLVRMPFGALLLSLLPGDVPLLRWPSEVEAGTYRLVAYQPDSGEIITIQEGVEEAVWSPTGHLVYRETGESVVYAVPFDPSGLVITGQPVPVLSDAYRMAISSSGLMVFSSVPARRSGNAHSLVARDGSRVLLRHRPSPHPDGELSPAGDRLVFLLGDRLMLFDLDLGTQTTLLQGLAGAHNPTWSPSGEQVVVNGTLDGEPGIFLVSSDADGSSTLPEEVFTRGSFGQISGWADETTLLTSFFPGGGNSDILAVNRGGERRTLLGADWQETSAGLSPDRRWLAYVAWEDGSARAYARSWPDLEHPTQLSEPDRPVGANRRTTDPVVFWSADSRTAYYLDEDGSVIRADLDVVDGSLVVLERTAVPLPLQPGDDVRQMHPDGERFLVMHPVDEDGGEDVGDRGSVTIITAWPEWIRERSGGGETND